MSTVYTGISELTTNDPDFEGDDLLARVPDAALVVEDGRVAWTGPAAQAPAGGTEAMPEIRWRLTSSFPRSTDILYGTAEKMTKRVAQLTDKLPFYDVRHLVRPGLTGWAQVKYGYAGSSADALEKLQYEFFYLRRQSLSFDAQIVGRTLRAVFCRQGR